MLEGVAIFTRSIESKVFSESLQSPTGRKVAAHVLVKSKGNILKDLILAEGKAK
jgi:hypothetical protein